MPLGPVERVPSSHHCSSVLLPSLSQVFPTPLLYAYPSMVNFGLGRLVAFSTNHSASSRVKARELQRQANHWQPRRLGKLPLFPDLSSCWSFHATAYPTITSFRLAGNFGLKLFLNVAFFGNPLPSEFPWPTIIYI